MCKSNCGRTALIIFSIFARNVFDVLLDIFDEFGFCDGFDAGIGVGVGVGVGDNIEVGDNIDVGDVEDRIGDSVGD
jgi:hypothetical protein